MNLRQLQYFIAVATSGSFTAAARVAHVSQPALGHQIRELEATLGTVLLERHARGVHVTKAGEVLLEHARQLLDQVERTKAALAPFRQRLAGEITLGYPPTPGRLIVPDLIMLVRERSDLKIALHSDLTDELLPMLQGGAVDVAFCYGVEGSRSLLHRPLYHEVMFLIGPPHLVDPAAGDVAFDELQRFSLVLDSRFRGARGIIERVAKEKGIELDVNFEVEQSDMKQELMLRHGRCTIVPYGLYVSAIEHGDLGARRVVAPTVERTLSIVFRSGLAAEIQALFAELVGGMVRTRLDEGAFGWRDASDLAATAPAGTA